MKEAINYLKGKRTYFCVTLGVLYIIGAFLGFYELDEKTLAVFGLGGLAFLRAAIRSAPEKSNTEGHRGTQRSAEVLAHGHKIDSVVPLVLVCAAVTVLTGCASFSTTQTDFNYEDGKPVRQITTRAKARTFFDAKSALASFHATQTDKTQSAKVGALNQEASGTNAVAILEKLEAIVKALPK